MAVYLAVLTTAAGWLAGTAFGLQIPNGAVFKDATFATFVGQLLLIHSLGFFKVTHAFNGPSWSISVEFYTYLVFGALCLIPRYVARHAAFIAVSGGALLLLAFGGGSRLCFRQRSM